MDQTPHKITPVPGPKTIEIKTDYRIEIAFRDPDTGAVLADFTGQHAVLVSELLESLPSEALERFVRETAARMVALHGGLADG